MKSVLRAGERGAAHPQAPEEVVDDAVKRGRMTRDDAQQMVQTLLQRSARQTDDFLSDLERMLGRGDARASASPQGRGDEPAAARRAPSNLPIADYDELSAAQVQERLDGLTPAELRKLRDYERRHANRKTVLDRDRPQAALAPASDLLAASTREVERLAAELARAARPRRGAGPRARSSAAGRRPPGA